jgi:putative ubiquitin-RnfH superfamily antitoxin RatB of RatAB toxin-antitoxin module
VDIEVPDGVTLQDVQLLLADEIEKLVGSLHPTAIGIWGKVKPPHYVLRQGDRLEFYRPLKADPKQARRARVERRKQVNR